MKRHEYFYIVTFFSAFFVWGFILEEFDFGYNLRVIACRFMGGGCDVNLTAIGAGLVLSFITTFGLAKIDGLVYAPPREVKQKTKGTDKIVDMPMFLSNTEEIKKDDKENNVIMLNSYEEGETYYGSRR